jgi:D-arabinose 1-dehydrogenase-like Zn-dependent alcohol dehydrogenase
MVIRVHELGAPAVMKLEDTKDPVPGKGEVFVKIHAPGSTLWEKNSVVQVAHPNGPLKVVERGIPETGTGSVRIKVQARGVCRSDSFIKEGTFPGIQYLRVSGHEIAGLAWRTLRPL